MKLSTAALTLVVIFAATGLEAWPGKKRLPRPIDSPVVRPKVQEHHKPGKRGGRHRTKFTRNEWGAEWSKLYTIKKARPVHSWLFQD